MKGTAFSAPLRLPPCLVRPRGKTDGVDGFVVAAVGLEYGTHDLAHVGGRRGGDFECCGGRFGVLG